MDANKEHKRLQKSISLFHSCYNKALLLYYTLVFSRTNLANYLFVPHLIKLLDFCLFAFLLIQMQEKAVMEAILQFSLFHHTDKYMPIPAVNMNYCHYRR